MVEARICGQCGFFKPDCILELIGTCAISGNIHFEDDVCEAEKEAKKEAAKDGSIQDQ